MWCFAYKKNYYKFHLFRKNTQASKKTFSWKAKFTWVLLMLKLYFQAILFSSIIICWIMLKWRSLGMNWATDLKFQIQAFMNDLNNWLNFHIHLNSSFTKNDINFHFSNENTYFYFHYQKSQQHFSLRPKNLVVD